MDPVIMNAATIASLATRGLPLGEATSFVGLTIAEPLDLSDAAISSVDFSNTTFTGPVSFARARFTGLSWFKTCVFNAAADFSGAMFSSDARFDHARFESGARFSSIEACGMTAFDHATFCGATALDHASFLANLSFAMATFQGSVSLCQSACFGGLWLEGARFAEPADLEGLDVHGRAWLKRLRIGQQSETQSAEAFAQRITSYGYQWR